MGSLHVVPIVFFVSHDSVLFTSERWIHDIVSFFFGAWDVSDKSVTNM